MHVKKFDNTTGDAAMQDCRSAVNKHMAAVCVAPNNHVRLNYASLRPAVY